MKKIDLTERFTDHFVLQEFLASPTAERHGLPNIPLKCHLSFDPRNYRHGAVRTEHLTEQLNQLVLQPVSSHCWLDQAVEEDLPF